MQILVSQNDKHLLAFGCVPFGSTSTADFDPLLIRWAAQDAPEFWTPGTVVVPSTGNLSSAGFIRVSRGSQIVRALPTRQTILVYTNSHLFSLQYTGTTDVFNLQELADNISLMGPRAVISANNVTYWMGTDKFYGFTGTVETLPCTLRNHVFNNLNYNQKDQVIAGTSEGFHEIWWFYPSKNSEQIDSYVVYNYLERIWYYGTMARTAWLDSGLRDYPLAATYNYNLVDHESGLDNNETGTPAAINAYISSSEFDIGDGHNFGFVWRILPDLTFENSTANTPTVNMTLYGLYNSGSGSIDSAGQSVVKGNTYIITEEFTGQIYTRVRGRQMIFKIDSNQLGTAWQLGAPRIDIRPDGRR